MYVGRLLSSLVGVLIVLVYVAPVNGPRTFPLPGSNTTPSAISTASATAPVFAGLVDVTFVDQEHGWMLSEYDLPNEEFTVDATTDGGQTWQTISVLGPDSWKALDTPEPDHQAWGWLTYISGPFSPLPISDNPDHVAGLRFADSKDGWAFGPDLFATHDGGKTWHQQMVDGDVLSLEIVAGTLWMLQATCKSNSECDSRVLISTDKGQTWQPGVPLIGIVPLKLAVADAQSAWLLHDINTDKVGILATTDSGKTWKSEPIPDRCYGAPVDLAASDRQTLWYACGTMGAGDLGAKLIFSSPDGGRHWQLKGKATLPPEADDNVTPVGAIERLYALSEQSVWMTLYRNAPIRTNDGGGNWLVVGCALDGTDTGGGRKLIWVNPRHIWYYSERWLLHTRDGGSTWTLQRASSYFVADLTAYYLTPGCSS